MKRIKNKRLITRIVCTIALGTMALATFFSCHEQEHVASIPTGKLPWPHQWPGMLQDEYDEMINNLNILNNFGLYQANETASNVYLHDSLDIALANGTKLYAMESGYVKVIHQNKLDSGLIMIGETEGDSPGYAWMYGHANNFQFNVGDHVNQGEYIANVFFEGTPHLELGRIFLDSNAWENLDQWTALHPDDYFVFIDTEPPTIMTPFYYFKNNSDIMFNPQNQSPQFVSGDVDIVVPMRDGGEFAHNKASGSGDRLAVTRIEYEISGSAIISVNKKSFDFTKMIISWTEPELRDRAFVVYKHYMLFSSQLLDDCSSKCLSYYIITNTPGTAVPNDPELIDCADRDFAWNTNEKDNFGNPRFPDGVYTITVTAYDSSGNRNTASDTVLVKNTIDN